MGGKASRRKGHQFERDIANDFRAIMPGEKRIRRGWQAREGADAADVVVPVFWVECKRMKKAYPLKALDQAEGDAAETGLIPIAICKEDRRAATVTLYWEDMKEIIEQYWIHINE